MTQSQRRKHPIAFRNLTFLLRRATAAATPHRVLRCSPFPHRNWPSNRRYSIVRRATHRRRRPRDRPGSRAAVLVMMGLRGNGRPPHPYVFGIRKMRADGRNRVGPRHALVHNYACAVDFHGRWRTRVEFGLVWLWFNHRRVTLELGGCRWRVEYGVWLRLVVAFLASSSPDQI